MTHHTDPFEYSEYKRKEHKDILWLLPVIIFIGYLIARTVATFVWGV